MKKLVMLRRSSQALSLALFVYILWSTTYPLKGGIHPGLFFKIDPLVMINTSISERVIVGGTLTSIGILLFTLIFGRFFCGWICPMGTAIDMTGALNKRSKSESDVINLSRSKPKFYILSLIFILSVFGLQVAWVLDPMVIAARFVSLNLIPAVTVAMNSFFIFLIKGLGLYGPVHDLYRALKTTLLGVHVYYFAHSGLIFALFALVCGISLVTSRLWCRMLCPLGAIYALVARFAPLRRAVKACVKCRRCKSVCRMGAIKDDLDYAQGECIMCMDCVYDCPQHITRFRLSPFENNGDAAIEDKAGSPRGISRAQFIMLAFSAIGLAGFKSDSKDPNKVCKVIRPPASLKEDEFLNRCVRCGNCMKVCITNGLQPAMLESGIEGIWTPRLVPEIGYCEYQCTLCGNTCPTGAIPAVSLERKRNIRLGIAEIDRSICLPWAKGEECIVCQEHCPVSDKAIKLQEDVIDGKPLSKPYIDEILCIGCGICQNKCPVRPVRAVRVSPRGADRT